MMREIGIIIEKIQEGKVEFRGELVDLTVGFIVVGTTVVDMIVGFMVVGNTGLEVVGEIVLGISVVGEIVLGLIVLGLSVLGLSVLGLIVLGVIVLGTIVGGIVDGFGPSVVCVVEGTYVGKFKIVSLGTKDV